MSILRSCRTSIGRKYLMALSGLLLGVFLFLHLAGNSIMFWGRNAFDLYADRLHSLGVLLWIFDAGLFIMFTLHIITSVILFFENRRARSGRYAARAEVRPSGWGARTMPYTGAAVLVFLVVHLSNFSFGQDPESESMLVRSILARPLYSLYYVFSLLALTLHISHGFWSLFQTLGVNHPGYNGFIRKGAISAALFAGIVFIIIPVLFFINRQFLMSP